MTTEARTVYGIDLGTTYSCIARVDAQGEATVIPNNVGSRTTPSAVMIEGPQTILVGQAAKDRVITDPDRVVEMVKRHMGEAGWRWSSEAADYSPEEISAFILRKLASDAAEFVGEPVSDVVITCPAYFGIAEREATATAGKIAGLNVLEIINEPTAAAIAYGLQESADQAVLVYDLGGGTFDVTIIEITNGSVTVRATSGNHHLGGRDWDSIVVQYLAQQWMQDIGGYDDPTANPAFLGQLWRQAEAAKVALTAQGETTITVIHDGQEALITLTRQTFDELTAHLVQRTIDLARMSIEDANRAGVNHIDQVVLVGGSTKMPQVSAALRREFGLEPRLYDPDWAVARGAAIYGHKLLITQKLQLAIDAGSSDSSHPIATSRLQQSETQRVGQQVAQELGMQYSALHRLRQMAITNITSHSFGVVVVEDANERYREVIENLVLRGDPLPSEATQEFGTLIPNQSRAELVVMENDWNQKVVGDLHEGREIGRAVLSLPPNLPQSSPIEVTFALDHQGRLHVTGIEMTAKGMVEAVIETRGGMTQEELTAAQQRQHTMLIRRAPRVFMSHSSDDNAFARRLVKDLRLAGADVWIDLDEIMHSDFISKINEGLSGRDWALIVLSPSALRSPWVATEVNTAYNQVLQKRMRAVIPVIADPCDPADIPPIWATWHRYDATRDYNATLKSLLQVFGLER